MTASENYLFSKEEKFFVSFIGFFLQTWIKNIGFYCFAK